MSRKILLVEPNYQNKYPPIGLMKIATYHKMLGDSVVFFKGDIKDIALNFLTDKCIAELCDIVPSFELTNYNLIKEYIKTGRKKVMDEILSLFTEDYNKPVFKIINKYKQIYRNKITTDFPKFDRVYITTLFTFYWEITIETIEYCKNFVTAVDNIMIGGVMATVLADDIEGVVNIAPFKGLLDKPNILDKNDIIVDLLPLDYSILDEIDYQYPTTNSYYGYLTRGCIRKCSFCAVPILEPIYQSFLSYKPTKTYIDNNFGEQRNLLLLDNNVLASKQFEEIIQEIKELGFEKGATFKRKNILPIYISKIILNQNVSVYEKKSIDLLKDISRKCSKLKKQLNVITAKYGIEGINCLTGDILINEAKIINLILDEYWSKQKAVVRYVDFNQGVDARLINEKNISLLSQIAIKPLRIAFDSLSYKDTYIKAIKLAAKYEITNLSNYILYNEKDRPEDLYERLKINIKLCDELNINIYSFPMKYHPIVNANRFNRDYIGEHWNRKFIRAIQTILNATKGKVGKGLSFFYEAFGSNIDDFMELLYMPETFILYRFFFKDIGLTSEWRQAFNALDEKQLVKIKMIIEKNNFNNLHQEDQELYNVLKFYSIKRENIILNGNNSYSLKNISI